MSTPLSRYFYAAWKRSGVTLEKVGRDAGVALSTVGHYIQGKRGGGKQARTVGTIRAIAEALDVDPDEAVRLAGVEDKSPVSQAILDDPSLTKRDKQTLIALLESLRDR